MDLLPYSYTRQIKKFVNKYDFDMNIKPIAIKCISIIIMFSKTEEDFIVQKILIQDLIKQIRNEQTKLKLNNMMIDYIENPLIFPVFIEIFP